MAGVPPKIRPSAPDEPYIPATQRLAEVTVKGVVLGLALSVLLGAANTYLGLKAGLTVAAAIPAAVVSLAFLRMFRRNNVLENNMVQTIASAGTAVASGVLFTIPALLVVGYWTEVDYWATVAVAVVGGMLGVLFTVPLRRALIVEERLAFPEGVATAEVLKAGDRAGVGIGALLAGGVMGALYKLVQSGLRMWQENALFAQAVGGRVYYGIGTALSPALMGVGSIVGLHVASLVFAGGLLAWMVGIPIYTALHGDLGALQGPTPIATATAVWRSQVRYIGVGAMLVGGMWSLVRLRRPLARAVGQGLRRRGADGAAPTPLRTEQDLSARTTFLGVAALTVPMFFLYAFVVQGALGWPSAFGVAAVLVLIMLVTGFLFSAVGAYMAGLVGSSNNPISGVTILTLIVSAITLKLLGLGPDIGPAATIFVAAVIAIAGSIASDNLQDLKAGHMLGATPRKQQFMLMVGAVGSAFFLAPIVQALVDAAGGPAGIGSTALPAPQAGLMAAVSQGIFGAGLPYALIAIGALVAAAIIAADLLLERAGAAFRLPVMAVAVGIYLPITVSTPIFIGGVAAWAADRILARRAAGVPAKQRPFWDGLAEQGRRGGILLASGLIAGEALVGILIAFLVGVEVDGAPLIDAIALGRESLAWPGLVLLLYATLVLAYTVLRPVQAERARRRRSGQA